MPWLVIWLFWLAHSDGVKGMLVYSANTIFIYLFILVTEQPYHDFPTMTNELSYLLSNYYIVKD